ncbi:MAG TPA: hypothetical protein ENF38_01280 [Candidatus Aenigmarchaeota archaeon]|nr:hypothetical protein [Candidatus Aenigmarchaeota archaeon]
MKYQIGVIGSAVEEKSDILKKAREIGKEIARYNCVLLTGATTGVSYEAVKGAKENNGLTIGFSPASNLSEHVEKYKLPVEYFDVIIFTGFGFKGRNVPFIRSCDAVVAISGRIGTLNEFTIAYDERKVIGILKGTGGLCDDEGIEEFVRKSGKKGGKIIHEFDPKSLIKKLMNELRAYEV